MRSPASPWATTVFLAGDGNLAGDALHDEVVLREAARAGRARVAWLRDGNESAVFEAWVGGRRRARVVGVPVNTGDPAVLQACLQESAQALGVGRRVLVLWGHGTGWAGAAPTRSERRTLFGGRGPVGQPYARGLVSQDAGSADWLETREILQVLQAECAEAPLALLGFDACYMAGVELLATLSPYAEVLVAGPDAVPGAGWDYRALVGALTPTAAVEEVAAAVVTSFRSQHPTAPGPLVAVTGVGIRAAHEALDALGAAAGEAKLGQALVEALGKPTPAPYGGSSTYGYDVADVAALFVGLGSARVAAAAQRLEAAARAACVVPPTSRAVGLSAYLGDTVVRRLPSQYAEVVPADGPWFRFLQAAWGTP